MKRTILLFFLIGAVAAGATWFVRHTTTTASAVTANAPETGRKILYYQSPMHPWIKSDKPGKCPICGMNLVPVYATDDTNTQTGFGLKLNPDSVSVANVQTVRATELQIVRTERVAGAMDTGTKPASFVFTAYERDFVWLETNEAVNVSIPALPEKTYSAKIESIETNRDDQTQSLRVKAVLSENLPLIENGFYAEGRVMVDSPEVLAVPRSAVLSPGGDPLVYVYAAGGRYEARKIKLGRIGDDYAEVLDGLKEGETVVTSGNLLIDAEAQISQNADN